MNAYSDEALDGVGRLQRQRDELLAALKALLADVQQDIDAGRIKAAKNSRYMRDIAAARAATAKATKAEGR